MEKRNFTRIRLEGDALLETEEAIFLSQLLDISLKGALIVRPANCNFTPPKPCTLRLQLLDSEVVIEMSGHIAHLHDEMIGICCDQIDLDSITHLRRIVELNLGDSSLLERELAELGQLAGGEMTHSTS